MQKLMGEKEIQVVYTFVRGEMLFGKSEPEKPQVEVQGPVQIWKIGTADLPRKKFRLSIPTFSPDQKSRKGESVGLATGRSE